ncbi:hypothetical protein ACFL5O_06835 [Myxococcota bacterium]
MKEPILVLPMALILTCLTSQNAQGHDHGRPQKSPESAPKNERTGRNATRFSVEVMVLHATHNKKPNQTRQIDPRIGPLPELAKEPFSLYDHYVLLDRQLLPLVRDNPKSVNLPDGRVLRMKLLQVLPHDSLRFSASINRPGGKDFLPLLAVKARAGQAFIVAGQSYQGGILVLVMRVVK